MSPLSAAAGHKHQGVRRRYTRVYRSYGKRLFDVLFALILLPLLAPIIVLLWCAVRLDGGPGFYGHWRIGYGGQRFQCWKLRSMYVDADLSLANLLAADPEAAVEWAEKRKLTADPRVTSLGRWLRRLSLDELPQVWNVLRGEMSFVGPRPVTEEELSYYAGRVGTYLDHRPGITGFWQVNGRDAGCFQARVAMDHCYAQRLTFGLDLSLIILTVLNLFSPNGR